MAQNTNTGEAIVVLGLRFDTQGKPQPELLERIDMAAALHRQRMSTLVPDEQPPFLIVSGGYPASALIAPSHTEEGVMKELAIQQGVPEELIKGESQSLDTWGNALFSKRIAVQLGLKRLRVITSLDHLPYALDVFRHTGGDEFDISGAASSFSPLTVEGLTYHWSAAYHMRFIAERATPGDDLAIQAALVELIPAYSTVFPDVASPNFQNVIHLQGSQRKTLPLAA